MSLALGDINAAVLNGIADKLSGVVASLGPEESAVVTAAIQQLSDHASALEKQTAADAQAIENPLLTRIDAMQQTLDKAVNALLVYQNGFSVVPAISPRELPPKP